MYTPSLLLFFSLFLSFKYSLSLSSEYSTIKTRYVYALLHPVLPETYDQTHLRRKSRSMKTQLTHRLQRGMTRSHVLSIQHAIR